MVLIFASHKGLNGAKMLGAEHRCKQCWQPVGPLKLTEAYALPRASRYLAELLIGLSRSAKAAFIGLLSVASVNAPGA